ncbi:MAG: chitobiase/beta-hexosaminidase C-terminal domain-containing protein [Chloroflexi bacterium]|nr:chitobiase/beta-hexosaminidase C-terminal domain-containing protein [Chloroflexota bacterium]
MSSRIKKFITVSLLAIFLCVNSFPAKADGASSSVFSNPAATTSALSVDADKRSGVYYADNGISVVLFTPNNMGTAIVYTTDGTTPVARRIPGVFITLQITHGKKYTSPIPLAGNKTIKAIALDMNNILRSVSPVGSFSYEIIQPTPLIKATTNKMSSFKAAMSGYSATQKFTAKNNRTGSFPKGGLSGINCTWYTYVHIKYNLGRNVLFSTNSPLNGKDWYANIYGASNQVKYPNLEALIKANNNKPVYNIVVSFEKNPEGGGYGHVMLIDAIINGKIYYSDSFDPGNLRVSNSISDFKNKYSGTNGKIIGVVHLK